MSVIIRLQGLSWSASAMDIRNFFQGLSIPPGGVRIIGGEKGDAFIAFTTDEDARQAMMMSNNTLNGNPVQLFLSSKTEMQNTIVQAKNSSAPVSAQGVTPTQPVNASPSIDSTPNLNFGISQSPQAFPPTNQLPNNSLVSDPAALQPALASLSQLHGLLPPNITQALGYLASANLGNRTAPNQSTTSESDSRNLGQFPLSDNFNNSNISGNFPPSSESNKDPGYYMPPSTKSLDGFPGQNNQPWVQQSSDRSSNVHSNQDRGNERNNFPPFGNHSQGMIPPPFAQNSHLFDTNFPQGGYRAPFPASTDHRFSGPGQRGKRFPTHINQPFPEPGRVDQPLYGQGRVDQRFTSPQSKEQFPHTLGRTGQPTEESSRNQTSSNIYSASKHNPTNVDVKTTQNPATSVQKPNITTSTDMLSNELDEFGRIKRPSSSTPDDRSRERDRSRRDSPRDREKRERSRDRDSRRRDRDDDRKLRRDRDRDRDRDRRTRDSDRDRRERSRDIDRKSSPSSESARRSKKRSLSPASKEDKTDNRKRQDDQPLEMKTKTDIPTSTAIPSVPPMQPLFPVIPQLDNRKGLLGAPPSNLTPLIPNISIAPPLIAGISPNRKPDATPATSDGHPPPLMGLPLSRNTPNIADNAQVSTRLRRSRFDNRDEIQTSEDLPHNNPTSVTERPPFIRNEVGYDTDIAQRSIIAGPGPKPLLDQPIPLRPEQQNWNKPDSVGSNRVDDLGKGLQTFPKEQERRPALLATPDSSTLNPAFKGDSRPHGDFRGPPHMMPPFENRPPNFKGPPGSESDPRKPYQDPEGDFDGRSNNSRPMFEGRAGRLPFRSEIDFQTHSQESRGPLLRENFNEGRPPHVGGRPFHDRPINPNFEEGQGKQFDGPPRFGPQTGDFDARRGPPGRDFQSPPVEHQGRGDFNRPPFPNQHECRDMFFREGGRPPFDKNAGGNGPNFRDDGRPPNDQSNRGGQTFRDGSRPPFHQNDRRGGPNDRPPFDQNIRGGPNFRDDRLSFDQSNRGGPNFNEGGRPPFDQNDIMGRPNFRDDERPPFDQNNRDGPNFRDDGRPPFEQNNIGGPNFRDDGRPPFDQNNIGGPNFREDGRPPMGGPNFREDGRLPMGGPNFREDGGRPPFDQDNRRGPNFRQDGRSPFDQDNRSGPNFRDGRPPFDKDSRGGSNFREDGRPPFDQDDRRGGPNIRENRPPFDQNKRGEPNLRDLRGSGLGFRDDGRPPFENNDAKGGPNVRENRPPFDQHNRREEGRLSFGHKSERRDGPVLREDRRPVDNRTDRRDGRIYRDDRRQSGGTRDERARTDDRNDYRDRRRREHSEDKHEDKNKTGDKHETKSEGSDNDLPLCTVVVDEMVKETSYRDIRKFFSDCLIPKDGIKLLNDENGRPIGKAYIKFGHQEAYRRACQMNRMRLNSVAVRIKPVSKKEYDEAIDSFYPDVDNRGSNDIEMSQSITATLRALKGDSDQNVGKDMVVKICQLPNTTTAEGIKRFFSGCDIAKNGEAVFIESDRKSECTGICFVEFANEKSYKSALSQKRQYENCAINIEQGSKKDIEMLVKKMKTELGKSFTGAGQGDKVVKSDVKPKAKEEPEQKNEANDDKTTLKDSKNMTCTCLRIRNIPYDARNYDIRCIFDDLGIHINNVQIPHDAVGKPCGEAFMDVGSCKDVEKAMTKDNVIYRDKVLKMTPLCRSDMISMLRNFRQSLQVEKSSKQDVFYYVKATNLPASVSTGELMTFFSGYNPAPESIRLNILEPNQSSECSSALVGFRMREDAERAVSNVNQKPLRNRPVSLAKVML